MYTLLNNTASGFANSVSVDRIGVVPAADPMNCVVAAEVALDVLVVEAVVEAFVVAEEVVAAEAAVAAVDAEVVAADYVQTMLDFAAGAGVEVDDQQNAAQG